MSNLILYLTLYCILTIILETVFFLFTDYKNKLYFIPLSILTNIFTNVSLNFYLICNSDISIPMIILCEILVVIVEYIIYSLAYSRSKSLFILTFFANLCSFLLGLFILFILTL